MARADGFRSRKRPSSSRRKIGKYAFGELDDAGKNRLATFAADHRCTPDFRPTEGRMYFRKNG
jgi:hypothetical protein